MSNLPNCPQCNSEYTYEDGTMFVCPECGYEWPKDAPIVDEDFFEIKDANGAILKDGDSVTVIKDLKLKGSSSVIKVGTKIKNIRLIDKPDHNIDCKIDGIGATMVTAAFVKESVGEKNLYRYFEATSFKVTNVEITNQGAITLARH